MSRRHPEQDWQDTILQWAAMFHWKAFFIPDWMYRLAIASMKRSKRGDRQWPEKGFPDLVLCKPPRLLFVECKSGRNQPTTEQLEWHRILRECGATVKVWRESDLEEVIATLGG